MTEMTKLATLLEQAHIPFEVRDHWAGTKQICYPNCENIVCDAVCFPRLLWFFRWTFRNHGACG